MSAPPRSAQDPLHPVPPLPEPDRSRWIACLRALADPSRLELLRLVAAQPGPVTLRAVADHVALSQGTVSHHLRVLREAGLLRRGRAGRWALYALAPEARRTLGELPDLLGAP